MIPPSPGVHLVTVAQSPEAQAEVPKLFPYSWHTVTPSLLIMMTRDSAPAVTRITQAGMMSHLTVLAT